MYLTFLNLLLESIVPTVTRFLSALSSFASNFRTSCIISLQDPVKLWTIKRLKTRLGKSLKNRLYKILYWEEDAAVDN